MFQSKRRLFELHSQRLAVTIFFLIYLAVGLCIFGDYGLSWDEPTSRELNGLPNYQAIMELDATAVEDSSEKYHGPAFEILLIFVEDVLGLSDSRDIYLTRHLMTFLFFFASTIAFYGLLHIRFQKRIIALAGAAFLILSPRIFAESFYNSKDLVLLSCFIFSLSTLARFLRHMDFTSALLHAAACGFAIDVRIVGVVLPVITLILAIANRWTGSPDRWAALRLYLVGLAFFVIAFWPVLWLNPLHHFCQALVEMSRFSWQGSVLYFGERIKGTELPWHYIPVWLLITTPIAYTVLFAVGFGRFVADVFRGPRCLCVNRSIDLAMAMTLLIPLVAVIVLRSVLYGGWRHLYFVYPPFLYFSVMGLHALCVATGRFSSHALAKVMLAVAVLIPLILTAGMMIRMHPHQYVFFNVLAGKDFPTIANRFDMDYWGVSCRRGLEYLVENDSSPEIRVYPDAPPGKFNALLLLPEKRERLRFVQSPEEGNYLITNFRWDREWELEQHVFCVRLNGAAIMAICKTK